jgi:hypothetical protein
VRAEPPRVDAEYLVAAGELGDGRADRLDRAGQLGPEDSPPRSRETTDQTAYERLTRPEPAIGPVDGRRVDPDQDLVRLRRGPGYLFQPQHVGRPVRVVDDSFHWLYAPALARSRRYHGD